MKRKMAMQETTLGGLDLADFEVIVTERVPVPVMRPGTDKGCSVQHCNSKAPGCSGPRCSMVRTPCTC